MVTRWNPSFDVTAGDDFRSVEAAIKAAIADAGSTMRVNRSDVMSLLVARWLESPPDGKWLREKLRHNRIERMERPRPPPRPKDPNDPLTPTVAMSTRSRTP